MKSNLYEVFLLLFWDRSVARKFLIGVLLGLAFSIAVILSTIGLMDGFNRALRAGLKKSSGDVMMYSKDGFFHFDGKLKEIFERKFLINGQPLFSSLIQTESFLLANGESRGVVVKGVDQNFGSIVGLKLPLVEMSAVIGSEIARAHHLKIGDEIVLSFIKGSGAYKSLPSLLRFKVNQIVSHGIYQKDARTVYVNLNDVQRILEVGKQINMMAINFPMTLLAQLQKQGIQKNDAIVKLADSLRIEIEALAQIEFEFKSYWQEFSSLIEAVQAEKYLISIILQLIVLISVFNVLAFIYFISEKKAKEIFLFSALGLSRTALNKLWLFLVVWIWIISALLSLIFVYLFQLSLTHLPLFKFPAEIYHMPRIDLYISIYDYLLVFLLALLWILFITYWLLLKLKKKSLLDGLRQEFN